MSTALLELRLRRLERANRLWSLCALGSLCLWLCGASAPPREDVITAERFELVDGEGRVRAEMAIDEDGSAGFFVRDAEYGMRAALVHDASQTGLFLLDAEGTVRVGTAQYAHGGGGVALHGEHSKGAAVLYMKDGEGSLSLYDAEGQVRARLPE